MRGAHVDTCINQKRRMNSRRSVDSPKWSIICKVVYLEEDNTRMCPEIRRSKKQIQRSPRGEE